MVSFGIFEVRVAVASGAELPRQPRVVLGVAESRARCGAGHAFSVRARRRARGARVRSSFRRGRRRGGARRRLRENHDDSSRERRDVRRARSSPARALGGPRARRASRERAPSRERWRGRVDARRHPRDVAPVAPRVAADPRARVPPTRRDARPATSPARAARRRRAKGVGGPRAPRPDPRRRRERHRGTVLSPRRGRPPRRAQVRADVPHTRRRHTELLDIRTRVTRAFAFARTSISRRRRGAAKRVSTTSSTHARLLPPCRRRSQGVSAKHRLGTRDERGRIVGRGRSERRRPDGPPRASFQRPRASTRRRVTGGVRSERLRADASRGLNPKP